MLRTLHYHPTPSQHAAAAAAAAAAVGLLSKPQRTLMSGFCSLRNFPAPVIVPPVPTPAMKMSTLPAVARQILHAGGEGGGRGGADICEWEGREAREAQQGKCICILRYLPPAPPTTPALPSHHRHHHHNHHNNNNHCRRSLGARGGVVDLRVGGVLKLVEHVGSRGALHNFQRLGIRPQAACRASGRQWVGGEGRHRPGAGAQPACAGQQRAAGAGSGASGARGGGRPLFRRGEAGSTASTGARSSRRSAGMRRGGAAGCTGGSSSGGGGGSSRDGGGKAGAGWNRHRLRGSPPLAGSDSTTSAPNSCSRPGRGTRRAAELWQRRGASPSTERCTLGGTACRSTGRPRPCWQRHPPHADLLQSLAFCGAVVRHAQDEAIAAGGGQECQGHARVAGCGLHQHRLRHRRRGGKRACGQRLGVGGWARGRAQLSPCRGARRRALGARPRLHGGCTAAAQRAPCGVAPPAHPGASSAPHTHTHTTRTSATPPLPPLPSPCRG